MKPKYNPGQLFTFSFNEGTRYGLGLVCHFYLGTKGILVRFFEHCPTERPDEETVARIVRESRIAGSSLESAYAFKEGLLECCGTMELSEELAVWPPAIHVPLLPHLSPYIIVTNPVDVRTILRIRVASVEHNPLIPTSASGSAITIPSTAKRFWLEGKLKPYEELTSPPEQ